MDAPVSSPMHSRNTSSAVSSTQQSPANVVPPQPVQVKAPSTDTLLKEFSLVAEAAKRAQVAVMVRDFEGCGIS
ncbi:hypothetical protein G6O67_001109 [Ophiocordyceps sinensis]|uniref:Uncharacterized protein n=1 Tax=Ophiocordyceps sinensis TaxID=72228 RepID=A0A8H4V8J8_9HYPO|nr:hypothetical protein G6O67_001109 [Ophiocordyceps sinensis]